MDVEPAGNRQPSNRGSTCREGTKLQTQIKHITTNTNDLFVVTTPTIDRTTNRCFNCRSPCLKVQGYFKLHQASDTCFICFK